MDDRRQHSRQTTQLNIEVFDLHSGRLLGRIADLSAEGFMLVSEEPPAADSVWQCRLVPCPPMEHLHEVLLGADCLWSRPATAGQAGWCGFQIIDLADEQAQRLEFLLGRL